MEIIIDDNLLVFDILVLEAYPGLVELRKDDTAERKRDQANDGSRDHIRLQESGKAHPGSMYCDDLRASGKLGSEEDDRDEDEQRGQQVGKVWDQSEIIVKDNLCLRILQLFG